MTTNLFQGPFLAIPVWAVDVITKYGQPRDLQVLVGLVSLMERRKREVTASVTQISDHIGVSRETVKRSLKWLTDYGIITVRKRKKPTVNVYTVHYTDAGLGSRVTHTRVTGDPHLGSRVTHPGSTTRVTGDPSGMQKTLTGKGSFGVPIDIYINKEVIDKERAAGGRGVEMIFGSDEDYVDTESALPKKKKPNINSLVSHFVNNRQTALTRNYSAKELTILRSTMKTLKESGLTDFTIMQMISKFYSVTRWRESEHSVLLFAKKDIQKQILSEIDSSVETDDPVLQLMLNDFSRGELNLPWDKKQDLVLKKAIIMRATDVCYRYPEIVSELVNQYPGDFNNENFVGALTALNSLVRVVAGEESGEISQVLKELDGLAIPDVLLNGKTELLRPLAQSMVEAVYNYRRIDHGS